MECGDTSPFFYDQFNFAGHCNSLSPCGRGLGRGVSESMSPGVARQLVTFLVLPRKVTQRSRPQFTAPAGYPALLDWSGGCGTRTACSNITSDLAGVNQ